MQQLYKNMALPTTTLTLAAVKAELSAVYNDVGNLCRMSNINMFAKYKPVNLNAIATDTLPEWWKGADMRCNIDTPSWSLANHATLYWTYTTRYGGGTSPHRLHDFMGYNKLAGPPISKPSIPASWNPSNNLTISAFTVDIGTDSLGLTDLGLVGYVLGVHVQSAGIGTPQAWGAGDLTINWLNVPFTGLAWKGSALTFKFFLSQQAFDWTTIDPGYVKIAFPRLIGNSEPTSVCSVGTGGGGADTNQFNAGAGFLGSPISVRANLYDYSGQIIANLYDMTNSVSLTAHTSLAISGTGSAPVAYSGTIDSYSVNTSYNYCVQFWRYVGGVRTTELGKSARIEFLIL